MKLSKCKKALSPVVASIILIAVTVAVSIAVAAWMGALSIGFMSSSSITVTDVDFWDTTDYTNVTLTVKNTGTKTVTVVTVKVNGITASINGTISLQAGDIKGIEVKITNGWTPGNPYKFDLYDGSAQLVGSYQATAPS
jgi:flagellin-like protein